MRIFIDHSGHELLNHGDTAMLQTAIHRLKKIWPEAIICVFTDAESRLEKHCPGTIPIHPETRVAWNKIKRLGLFPRRLIKILPEPYYKKIVRIETDLYEHWPKFYLSLLGLRAKLRNDDINIKQAYKYISSILKSDIVLATGGGYLNDTFKWHAYLVLETIQLGVEHGKITALLGQGIGPLSDKRLDQQMRQTLPNVDLIGLREKRCGLPILLQQGVKRSKIIVTGDDAIELANRQRKPGQGNMIGINFRATAYSEVDRQIKKDVAEILRIFAEEKETHLIPIPISFHNRGEDYRAIDEIIPCGDKAFYKKTVRLDSPAKIIDRVGDCRLVVTGSYHGGVFALSQGIPVIGLAKSQYYKDKFHGLAEQFGEGCIVVLLDDPNRKKILSYALERMWHRSSSFRPRLLDAAKNQMENGQLVYQRLRELVEFKKAQTDSVARN